MIMYPKPDPYMIMEPKPVNDHGLGAGSNENYETGAGSVNRWLWNRSWIREQMIIEPDPYLIIELDLGPHMIIDLEPDPQMIMDLSQIQRELWNRSWIR